ncbi:aspartyl-tRNA(Asn)/glutamyl-tRNA(Gln) amidotransferase subunit A [Kribbella sp. VKM Ac-2527]|uniref:Aspartyl-tRNA(Asn)/glutamyl-tRNA(Gln) amidotransferase subunit A n=1 Tax=Kribbella caucasensis TaxID=2512215 RepID=A0A4R6J6N1_9ACTN|nr:amidase [Kribbella sp. VKM Ac-2527]TDO30016.1 aspartyl-tRNA(Asn)/glutamyl-tRNA(Gln) amidotransferase subunit A [Kribbella sp. VKM Ac-2527]
MTESLADLTATELITHYREKALSPVQVIEDVFARVETLEPTLCATYALDPDAARQAARESEYRWSRNDPAGPLDGVPVTVKENIATRGTPVPQGTAATDLIPATDDAPAAARLRAAGAVIFSKTTMPEYGMLSSGVSTFHPLTRNPWDPTRTAGGSSAGAAAAAAAGYGPIHLGTDIGGSIRLPAGWCGVVGLKPTHGRVAVGNPYPGRAIGPITRTAADAALALSVISGPDRRDPTSLPPIDDVYPEDLVLRGLRIGLLLDAGLGLPVDPSVAAAISAAAQALEDAGAIVEPIPPIITREMLDGLDRFWRVRSADDIAALPEERRAKVLPEIRRWVSTAGDLSPFDVFRGFSQMGAMAVAVDAAFATYDFILSPVAPITAFDAELAYPTDDPLKPFEHIAFTVPYNMSAHPAASVNCGWSGNLPIGLQIAGPRFADMPVLRLAAAVDSLQGEHRDWPTG